MLFSQHAIFLPIILMLADNFGIWVEVDIALAIVWGNQSFDESTESNDTRDAGPAKKKIGETFADEAAVEFVDADRAKEEGEKGVGDFVNFFIGSNTWMSNINVYVGRWLLSFLWHRGPPLIMR